MIAQVTDEIHQNNAKIVELGGKIDEQRMKMLGTFNFERMDRNAQVSFVKPQDQQDNNADTSRFLEVIKKDIRDELGANSL